MPWLLLSVQCVEILWVLFNYLGWEKTTTDVTVTSIADIHLAYMPYSHSIVTSLVIAALAWVVLSRFLNKPIAAVAVAIAILSHIALDLLTHTQDIAVMPFVETGKLGLGFYQLPVLAFFVETVYGLFCWYIFGGNMALFAVILLCNLANVSFFVAAIRGPEVLMAGHPLWIVTAIALQIVVTLSLVGCFSRDRSTLFANGVAGANN
jgi:membrane-bound metal-dependent hydrolase YbcI (DUF457 family)